MQNQKNSLCCDWRWKKWDLADLCDMFWNRDRFAMKQSFYNSVFNMLYLVAQNDSHISTYTFGRIWSIEWLTQVLEVKETCMRWILPFICSISETWRRCILLSIAETCYTKGPRRRHKDKWLSTKAELCIRLSSNFRS